MAEVSRRAFLKAGAGLAAVAGVASVAANSPKFAKATDKVMTKVNYPETPKSNWSVLRPVPDYGGAKVRYAKYDEHWLGTTEITGKIPELKSYEHGFMKAYTTPFTETRQPTLDFDPQSQAMEKSRDFNFGSNEANEGEPNPVKFPLPDPEIMTRHIRDYCYFLRADEVGIGRMPEYAYFANGDNEDGTSKWKQLALPYVIVVAIDMNLPTYWASSGYGVVSNAQSQLGYYTTSSITCVVARYIRMLGYQARSSNAANSISVYAPALISAGMGELCRTGDCVMHPRLGFRTKVGCVMTDLELVPDKPIDAGILDFCRVCKKCADECPSKAISYDDDMVEYKGAYMRWNSDPYVCAEFRTTNPNGSGCGRCVKVCPWCSKEESWFHTIGVWVGSNGKVGSKFLKSIDDMFGYGTEILPEYEWWLEWPELYPSGKVAP